MAEKNAYCGLMNKADGTYLYLVPEESGGKRLRYEDVDEYMTHMRLSYDKVEVNRLITGLKERVEYKVSPTQMVHPEDEFLVVKIAPDKMSAIGKFYPPTFGGKLMTREDIISRMEQCGVRFGTVDLTIDLYVNRRQYCTDLVLAEARLPQEGKSAEIVYHFNTNINQKPKTNEDGSVDFHSLDTVSHVCKGDKLATLIPADEGKPGIDVCGTIIKQQKVVRRNLRYGNKISINEAGTEIYSDVDGHASLIDEKVFVSDTLDIPTDVGPSTGDINYDGNVSIKGSVVAGYTVHAKGDIIVEGVVEGASLIADGQIILKRGIQGGTKGVLKAGSNIVAKFIESAEVSSGGYVQTEAIMHSIVSARTDVTVGGKKGFITGGEIHAGNCISAKTAGNTMGTKTLLEVGADPAIIEEYHFLEKRIPDIEEEVSKIDQILITYAKKMKSGEKLDTRIILSVKESAKTKERLMDELESGKVRYVSLHNEMEQNQNGNIKIFESIYPGCRIIISNVTYFVKTETQHSRFIRDRADIKIVTL